MSPNMADSNSCYTLEAEIGVSAMGLLLLCMQNCRLHVEGSVSPPKSKLGGGASYPYAFTE